MIKGIGCDILSINRIKNIIDSFPSFIKHTFSEEELKEYTNRNNDIYYLASRFAAKEAVVKSLKEYNKELNTIEILNNSNGVPFVRVSNMKNYNFMISLSYETEYVIAYVVLLSI